MSKDLFDQALDAAKAYHAALPAVAEFQPWPDDITWAAREGNQIPGAVLVQSDPGFAAEGIPAEEEVRALQQAIMALAPHAQWRLTYTEEEVGRDFLQRFGWFELVGPTGHFHSLQTRMTIGYWGPDLDYPWHQHGPEELYTILSGSADFMAKGEEVRRLVPGDTKMHGANQPHAMITNEHPILCFVFWRGEGLADDPAMSPG
ncbi:MAG: dimethylsulfonioproprionate lyase family protein [Leisingera sp.]